MKLTKNQLKMLNGKNGKTLIAYKKNIYDLSKSDLFLFGIHFNPDAGEDLTDFIYNAPHGDEVLERFPIIGELI